VRRVGALLLRLLAAGAILAGSVAAALALLGGNIDLSAGGESGATPPAVHGASTQPWPARPPKARRPPAAPTRAARRDASAAPLLAAGAATSWQRLAGSLTARAGLAVAPLGPGPTTSFGSLRQGHAWSTIKVPILVTVLRERGSRRLSAEEEGWAREALTASDNEAAAALFGKLEASHGGLDGASLAVEGTLRAAGDSMTVVATAPPPPGAVSTYGQTDWSLSASVEFLRSLGRGCLLDPPDTERVLGLMGEVIPEQRWGLGAARFPAGWAVEMKGGWGPEGSAGGPYLVRQSGIVSDGSSGMAVAMIARADSGSFDAGVEALNRTAKWLRQNLVSLGPVADPHC
jgi:hypothetical protein